MNKTCILSLCQTRSRPSLGSSKILFSLPKQEDRRKAWCAALGIEKMPKGHAYYCCEDHFDLPNDTKNWMEFNMKVAKSLKLKDDVIPHINIHDEFIPPKKVLKLVQTQASANSLPGPSGLCGPKILDSPMTASSGSEDILDINILDEGVSSSSDEEIKKGKKSFLERQRLQSTLDVVENNSRFYLGLPQNVFVLVKFLSYWGEIHHMCIFITLKKIRLDDAYLRLSIDFGTSVPTVQRLFVEGVKNISNVMQNFIFTPSRKQILMALPNPFRFRYSSVSFIIDCFEIEIEKPSNPVNQSFSWSEYKKCNTAKYLISATPHGFINFISAGFGGRISDNNIVVSSGYLDTLNDCSIMADRGFKNIAQLLVEKNCTLIRPPSVTQEKALEKREVKEAKRIAALRIHIERSIARIREFKMLDAHSKVNTHLLDLLDEIIVIACGLINFQGPLIKT